MSFIQLRDVSFRYETQKNYLFKNVSFTVGDGEKLAII
ncbi:MAG: energy-coupling factor ABC transporter ATP-binding protein, partial [Candidatus Cloacimonadota bacterium]